jgi:guanyl-specific ribonuclease Sa
MLARIDSGRDPVPAMSSRTTASAAHPLRWIAGLIVAVLAGLGYVQLDGEAGDPAAPPPVTAQRTLVVEGPAGPTDLGPTLERIERGERHEHRNDGAEFENRERRLPRQPRGHYREYVHPTPGQRGPGAQRVVIGRDGAVWYTPDHYASFRRVEWTFRDGVPR